MIKEIVNTDATEYIKSIDDSTIDLIILDPDYNDWDSLITCGFLTECIRILKETGNILMFTKQPFDYNLRTSITNYFRREFVWTFTNGGAWVSNRMPLVSFQKIYWCVKSKDFYFNERTGLPYGDGTKDFKRSTKVFGGWEEEGKNFVMSEDGTWIRDHFHFNKPQTGSIPGKPTELIKILIHCFCPDGGTIYDPFAGTGIIEKIGDETNREVIASEIDTERCMKIIDYFMKGDTE